MTGKNYKNMLKAIRGESSEEIFNFDDALNILQKNNNLKLNQSIDLAVNLGVDAKNTEQSVRGVVALPKGLGKKIKIGVFATDSELKDLSKIDADEIGGQEYLDAVIKGKINCDIYYASKSSVPMVAKAAKVLGPKKLMPSLKSGTVFEKNTDLEEMIKTARKGQLQFKTTKSPIVHAVIGKLSFSIEDLKENFVTFINALKNAKPSVVKKHSYIKSIYMSSTMSPSMKLNIKEFTD